jgi:nucleotide-binding universal stress UspA family protein
MDGSILVATDFEPASLEALALARSFAQKLALEIVLLHVYAVPIVVYPGIDPIVMPGLPEEIASAAKRALDALAAKNGIHRTLLRAGDPAREILNAVEETKPSLVVVGTRGRRGLTHALLGSVAEKVVRLSKVPVLTVHAVHAPG